MSHRSTARLLLKGLFLSLVLACAQPLAANAQQTSPVIGFVNLQRVGQEAKAAQGAGQKIETYRNSVEERIRQRQEALREEEQSLGRRRSILAPDAFREEERKFREKVDLAQREFQQIGRQLQQAAFEAQQTITQRINEVIRDVATEKGKLLRWVRLRDLKCRQNSLSTSHRFSRVLSSR